MYDTPAEEAARCYDAAARELRGAQAITNFPLPGELGYDGSAVDESMDVDMGKEEEEQEQERCVGCLAESCTALFRHSCCCIAVRARCAMPCILKTGDALRVLDVAWSAECLILSGDRKGF